MIREELVENGNRIRHYSDAYLKIEQVETAKLYDEAVDAIPCPYTYIETNVPIDGEEIDDSVALSIITGNV